MLLFDFEDNLYYRHIFVFQTYYLLVSINWRSLVTSWFVVQKIYSKMHLISCTNADCDITDLAKKIIKKYLKIQKHEYLENGTYFFYEIKKILNLRFRWHILRSYHFVAEVTFLMSLRNNFLKLSKWYCALLIFLKIFNQIDR